MPKHNFKDLTGMVFDRLTVVKRDEANTKAGKARWLCRCSCPAKTELVVIAGSLCNGRTKSCGCISSELVAARNKRWTGRAHPCFKHGHRRVLTPEYNSWRTMMQRCLNSAHKNYKYYGARGIIVCDRWRGEYGFERFLEDMGERPATKSLDRIDVNGNYEPSNCRWATDQEQRHNQRPRKKKEKATILPTQIFEPASQPLYASEQVMQASL